MYQAPIFPEADEDQTLQSFTFEAFLDNVKLYHATHPNTIPKIITVVARLYRKNVLKWLKKDLKFLFTWSDINVSQIIYKNNMNHCKPIADFMLDVCRFFYHFNHHSVPVQTFERFMAHPMYDFSKPYHWFGLADYVSYGQVLMALYCQQENRSFPSALSKEFITQSNSSIIKQFQKMFAEYFPDHLTIETIKIPHSLYKKCWHGAQRESTIKPYDIEICFYFVQQNKLSLNFVVDDLWEEGSIITGNSHSNIQVIPLMKNFSIYDWRRLEIMNGVIISQKDPDLIKAWKKTASKVFFYKKPTTDQGLGWLGTSRAEIFVSQEEALHHFYSIEQGYELISHLVQASMVNSLITHSLLFWHDQQKNQLYDTLYLNVVNDAIVCLSRYAEIILRAKDVKTQTNRHLSPLAQKLVSHFPLTGVLAMLAKINPKNASVQHLIPSFPQVLEAFKDEKNKFFVKSEPFTSKRHVMLSVLKPLPTKAPKLISDLINSFERQKSLQEFFGSREVLFCNNGFRISLEALSQKLKKKQGLHEFQVSQKPDSAGFAIHDLNALLVIVSQRVNPNGLVASRILSKLPTQEAKNLSRHLGHPSPSTPTDGISFLLLFI